PRVRCSADGAPGGPEPQEAAGGGAALRSPPGGRRGPVLRHPRRSGTRAANRLGGARDRLVRIPACFLLRGCPLPRCQTPSRSLSDEDAGFSRKALRRRGAGGSSEVPPSEVSNTFARASRERPLDSSAYEPGKADFPGGRHGGWCPGMVSNTFAGAGGRCPGEAVKQLRRGRAAVRTGKVSTGKVSNTLDRKSVV